MRFDLFLRVFVFIMGILCLLIGLYYFVLDGGPYSSPGWGFLIYGLLLSLFSD